MGNPSVSIRFIRFAVCRVRLDSSFLVSALQGACADCQNVTWLEQSQKQFLNHVWHLGILNSSLLDANDYVGIVGLGGVHSV